LDIKMLAIVRNVVKIDRFRSFASFFVGLQFFYFSSECFIFVSNKHEVMEEKLLQHYGVRPTAIRLLVWKQIMKTEHPFSLGDMELWLDTVDKSTLFRTLSLLEDQHLLHSIDDGSGQKKYCRCDDSAVCLHHDDDELGEHEEHGHQHQGCKHVHAFCVVCQRSFCIRTEQIPLVKMPDGFEVLDINYVVRGVCPDCKKK
jgi:Fur family ferric uptake transcriptional regulator